MLYDRGAPDPLLVTMRVGYDALPSLVTVELAESSSAPPEAETTFEGPVTIRDGELQLAEVVIGWQQILDLRPEPGTFQMVVKVTGRDESRRIGLAWDAACVELDEAAGDGEPEYPAQPEPVEHWWVSFLTEPPES